MTHENLSGTDISISIIREISDLKAESDAIILVHNYQRPELYEIADKIGDSLELSITAQKSGNKTIVFCGVDFMAETAKILSPDSRVLHPKPGACCPMAHMVTPDEIIRLKEKFPSARVVSYVNTTAETKALSDICCTSANVKDIINSCDSDEVIFLPDQNLAAYVRRYTSKQIISGHGDCCVHEGISKRDVETTRLSHPDTLFIAHPECRPEVIDMADAVCSTGGMVTFCRESSKEAFIIGTESGMINRLKREIPDKKFYPVGGVCLPMKLITLESVKKCLQNGTGEVKLSPGIIRKAGIPLERMIRISNKAR